MAEIEYSRSWHNRREALMAEAFSDEDLRGFRDGSFHLTENFGGKLVAEWIRRFLATITADRKRIEELERERDNHLESARLFSKNSDYYFGLLDKIAKNFGDAAYLSDDGSVQDSPLRAKMPKLVAELKKELNEIDRSFVDTADQTAEIERLRGALGEAIGLIKVWHNLPHPEDEKEYVWELYKNSPEMKRLDQTLDAGKE